MNSLRIGAGPVLERTDDQSADIPDRFFVNSVEESISQGQRIDTARGEFADDLGNEPASDKSLER